MTLVKRQGRGTWPEEYRGLFRPTFVEVQGRVFVLWTRSRQEIRRFSQGFEKPPTAVDENTINSERFWYFDNDTIDGCRKNRALAEAVRIAWGALLARHFPGRSFELFVVNEYRISDDFDQPGTIVHEEVTPTLRLWTRDDAETRKMREAYHVDELGPEKVLWPERLADGLFDLAEIFHLIGEGPDHPRKKEALEIRASWARVE